MKKLLLLSIMCFSIWFGQAQVSRTVESQIPGTLMFIVPDMKTVTDLTISGPLNAVDFRIIRDSMPALKNLDLKAVMIEQYAGTDGTYSNPTNPTFPSNYKAQEIPAGAFMNKTNFETVILPDSTKSISSKAFFRFAAKNPINIPKKVSNTGISSAFYYCATPYTVDPENTLYSALDGVLYNKSQSLLVQMPILRNGSFTVPTTVTSINANAFAGCENLSSVNIHQSVNSIIVTAFNSCSAQINVDENNATYSSSDGVLYNKAKTTLIQTPASKTGSFKIPDSVTSVGSSSFLNCKNITSVSIPQSVSSIGANAFGGCVNLATVQILSPTPPTITDAVFQNVNVDNCVLLVAGGNPN